jgi:hypothetical protein
MGDNDANALRAVGTAPGRVRGGAAAAGRQGSTAAVTPNEVRWARDASGPEPKAHR